MVMYNIIVKSSTDSLQGGIYLNCAMFGALIRPVDMSKSRKYVEVAHSKEPRRVSGISIKESMVIFRSQDGKDTGTKFTGSLVSRQSLSYNSFNQVRLITSIISIEFQSLWCCYRR